MNKLLTLLFVALALASCNNEQDEKVSGIPFQESENGLWGMLTSDGDILFSDEFKFQPTVVRENMFMVKNADNLWEIYKAEKKPVKVGGEYTSATLFNNGKAVVAARGKYVSIIDTDGKVLKTLDKIEGKEVDGVRAFFSGYAVYVADGYYGVIDENGKQIIPPNYVSMSDCSDGKFIAVDKKYEKMLYSDSVSALKYKVFNTKGKMLFEINGAKYAYVDNFTNGLLPVCVKKDGEKTWGIINDKQEVIVKPTQKIKQITEIRGDEFIYSNGTGWGVMNLNGNTVIRAKYDGLKFDSDGRLMAYTKTTDGKGLFKFINEKDDKIGDDEYLSCATFNMFDGKHTIVRITDTQWSLINSKCKQVENLPDMVEVSFDHGDMFIESDYVNITSLIDKLGFDQNGIGGVGLSDSPKDVVCKTEKYRYDTGTEEHPSTSPYWYDDKSTVSYWRSVNNVYVEVNFEFDGTLGRQTYKTKRVIDDVIGDYYWYHNEKIPTGYAWNKVKIKQIVIDFENRGKLRGKLHTLLESLIKRFGNIGKVEQKNDGAAIISLKDGAYVYVYMEDTHVYVKYSNTRGNFYIDEYNNAKEDMGKVSPKTNSIHWDFESDSDDVD